MYHSVTIKLINKSLYWRHWSKLYKKSIMIGQNSNTKVVYNRVIRPIDQQAEVAVIIVYSAVACQNSKKMFSD